MKTLDNFTISKPTKNKKSLPTFHLNKSRIPSNLIIIFVLIFLVCLLFLFSTIFALINSNSNTIVNGISIYGVDLSGLTVEEAKESLDDYISSKSDKLITFNHNDFSGNVTLSQLCIQFNIEEAVNSAYSIGRSDNIFKNNYEIFTALIHPYNISPKITYDVDIFNSLIEVINQNLPDLFLDPNYYIDNQNLIIVNGKDGVTTDKQELLNILMSELIKSLDDDTIIDLPVTQIKAKSIDIDSIHTEIFKTPTDAYYLTDPYVVYPSSNGLDFSISIDEAKEMLKDDKEQYTIPLKTLYPNVFTNDIGMEAFPDLLSEFSTSFVSSNQGRSANIVLASSKISGTVLMPGETFSFNQIVGQRTAAAGFKEAAAYSEGQVVQEIGGGICQVSSTLYNAALYANLKITERTNHYFSPGYVKSGLDATVSWGGPDFKFTNDRDYPIKIVSDTYGKNVHIYIYGLKSSNDYHVELKTEQLSTIYPETVYKYTSSLSKGSTRTLSSGSAGCKTASYKILYDNNWNFISKTQISTDVYNAHNSIIEVGI